MAGSSGSRSKPFGDIPGLNEDVRASLGSAFDALSNWRSDVANAADKHSTQVFDKMGAAAKAMGWPAEFVDLTRQQMQQASKMQLQMIDQVMDVWEQQLKAPGEAFSAASKPAAAQFPFGFPPFGNMPGMPNMPNMPGMPGMPGADMGMTAPLQFWMQAAEMWQKNWQQALSAWMEAQSDMMGKGGPGSNKR